MQNREIESREKLADRIVRTQLICLLGWGFFATYYLYGGHLASSILCTSQAIFAFVMFACARRMKNYLLLLTNVSMMVQTFGLVLEGLTSGQGQSSSGWFLCCIGLTAAHQVGTRNAFFWTFVACVGMVVVTFGFPTGLFPLWRDPSQFDMLIQQVSFAIIVLMMSLHAEWSSSQHEQQLIFLTDQLREQTRFLSLAEEVAGTGHWRFDTAEQTITYSPPIAQLLGLDSNEQVSEPIETFLGRFPSESSATLREVIEMAASHRDFFRVDITLELNNDVRFITCSGMSDMKQGEIRSVIGTFRDDTNAKRVQSQLRDKNEELVTLANYDSLTQLPNRHFFHEQLRKSINRSRRNDGMAALMLLDMDGFKGINDTMGHASGDAILQEVSERLQRILRKDDTVARLGGDEFTIILNGINSLGDVYRMADEVHKAITRPYRLDGKELDLGTSIGASLCPNHSQSAEELLSFADTAMYQAKAKGGGFVMYDPKMTVVLLKDRMLDNRLARASKNGEFYLDYQPQLVAPECGEQRIIGVEALLRWKCDGRTVPPAEFIPRLEDSGGIVEVGRWILSTACQQAIDWSREGWSGRMSVNISPVQFHDEHFVRDVENVLSATGFPAERLELEVTENMLIQQLDDAVRRLNQLRSLGITISIDDFGTGYCSLGYLKHLPFDRLKIDRTFVRDIPEGDDGTLISAIILLGHNMGITVLAEGVETNEQLKILQSLGCDEYQGFLFSRPLTPKACKPLILRATPSQSTIVKRRIPTNDPSLWLD